MKLLLDTHALIWLAEGSQELSPESRRTIDDYAAKDGLVVSAISFWEVAMLDNRGRIALSSPIQAWRVFILNAPEISEVPVDGATAIESRRLPGELHGDPADRLLVATARSYGYRLATRDRRLLDYGAQNYVKVLAI